MSEVNNFTLLKKAQNFLKQKGIAEFETDAEVLLSAALNIKRSSLALLRAEKPTKIQNLAFKHYILRRAKREPCAYIIGNCEFMGLEFKVTKDVLIPRPETELLTEEALIIAKEKRLKNVLDLCCGSGCIAISLAVMGNFEKITASDVSAETLKIAKENATKHNTHNVTFVKSSLFENIGNQKFDLIVSNPPYVSAQEYESLESDLKYEPKIALTDSKDGLSFYEEISEKAAFYLDKGGLVFVELNANKFKEIQSIFEKNKYKNIEMLKDYAGLYRILKTEI
ncbi:MAG: peptide chain release factor N(5)-glutamine methyltransferase [Elusimicrobiota bacterium]|jgi:release factor glutamine methyltransferase|nr:peptide chain release factor N(5)-glutamine methyltransferase [Elusimicrobiota bacterium]